MDDHEHQSESRGLPLQKVLVDTSDRRVALIWAVVAAVALFVLVAVAVVGADDPPVVVLIVLSVLALGAAGAAWRKIRVWAGWSNPQLHLPSSAPLRLGDQVVVRFRRTARGRSDVAGLRVTAELQVEERATYQQGTDTRTATETVHRQELELVMGDVVQRTVEVDIALDVPLYEAPPTMDLGNNEVRWQLVVDMEAPNAPDDESTFPLEVAPVVADRLQSGGVGR